METEQSPHLQLEDLVEEEDGGLLRKSSGKPKANGVTTDAGKDTTSSSGSLSENQGHEAEEDRTGNAEGKDADENGPDNGKLQINSVYFEKDQGVEVTSGVTGMKHNVDGHYVGDADLGGTGFDVTLHKHENTSSEIENQHPRAIEENSSRLESESLVELQQEESTSLQEYKDQSAVNGQVDTIEEIAEDLAEYDVETVIKKQNTHDLYCPKCCSRITRKVILRRKSKFRNLKGRSRRSRTEKVFESDTDDNSTEAQHYGTVLPSSVEDPSSALGQSSQGKGPEIFRCLSCFSYFIPTGNGFKLFRCFGDSSENYVSQHPDELLASRRSWFFSIFTSDKRESENEEAPGATTNGAPVNETKPTVDTQPLPHQYQSITEGMSSQSHAALGNDRLTQKNDSSSGQGFPSLGQSISSGNVTENGFQEVEKDTANSLTKGLPSVQGTKKNDTAPIVQEVPPLNDLYSISHVTETGSQKVRKDTGNLSTKEDTTVGHVQTDAKKGSDDAGNISTDRVTVDRASSGDINSSMLEPQNIGRASIVSTAQGPTLLDRKAASVTRKSDDAVITQTEGDQAVGIPISSPVQEPPTQGAQEFVVPVETDNPLQNVSQHDTRPWDILKSIVYGGLMESITSLGVVSSAVGSDASTLNVLALGLANLVGGLFVICNNLVELKNNQPRADPTRLSEHENRYEEVLGRRQNFRRHAVVAILSYLIFGSLPPVLYGFSFRKSDDKELKTIVLAAAALFCIAVLAIGKAHVQRPTKSYLKTVLQYVVLGFMASGISYVAGEEIKKLLDKFGWFNTDSATPAALSASGLANLGWASF